MDCKTPVEMKIKNIFITQAEKESRKQNLWFYVYMCHNYLLAFYKNLWPLLLQKSNTSLAKPPLKFTDA